MTRSLRVRAAGELPDMDEMLAALARRDDPTWARASLEWRLAHRCQLLLDRGEGMRPYRRDMQGFHRRLLEVAGDDRVELLHFQGCPLRGVETPDELEPMDYRPPAATPVIVLTDLGIARPPPGAERADAADWLAFAAALDATDCPLLLWVPYAPERWPAPCRS